LTDCGDTHDQREDGQSQIQDDLPGIKQSILKKRNDPMSQPTV